MSTPITPVMTFSPQTAAQASPFGGMQQSMFNTASSIKELAKQQMANKMMQEQLKTMPDMLQAQLGAAQQKIPMMQAQTGHIQQSTQLAPLIQAISAQNALTKQAESQRLSYMNSPERSFRLLMHTMTPEERATTRAQYPQQWNKMIAESGNAVLGGQQARQQSMAPSILTNNLLSKYGMPSMQQQQRPQPQQQMGMPQGMPQGMGQQWQQQMPEPLNIPQNIQQQVFSQMQNSGIQPQQPQGSQGGFQVTPESIALTKRIAEIAAQTRTSSPDIRKRADAGVAIDNFLRSDTVNNMLDTLTKYSGFMGRRKADLQNVLGKDGYVDYVSATEQMPSLLSGSIKVLEGYGTTDAGMAQALNFFKRGEKILSSNPQQAVKFINNGIEFLHSENQALNAAASNVPSIGGYRSPMPAPRLVGQQPQQSQINIPTFSSKAEAHAWLGSLSPSDRQQAMAKLKGGG